MTVTFDARMTGGNSSDGFSQQASGVTSISSTGMTIGTATAIYGLLVWGKSGSGQPSSVTMTWNSVSMTSLGIFGVTNGSDSDQCAIFGLTSPASGNRTLAAAWTNSADCYMSCISVNNSITTANGINPTNTVQASGTTATITSATGNMTIAVMTGNGGAPTTNFNQIFVNAPFAPGGGASYQAGSASNAHTFTGSGSTINAVVGIDVVDGGSPPPSTGGFGQLIDNMRNNMIIARTIFLPPKQGWICRI